MTTLTRPPLLRRETLMTKVKRRVGQHVRRMTRDELQAWLVEYHANWAAHKSIVSDPVKRLTGGFNSQSINDYTKRRVFDALRNR